MLDMGEQAVKNVIPDLPRKDLLFLNVCSYSKWRLKYSKEKIGLLLYHIIKNQCQSQHIAIRAQHIDFL
jgi:hypothetical protein